MNEPRRKSPTSGMAVFFVAIVLIVIGTLVFNALRDKRQYDEQNQPAAGAAGASAASAAQ